MSFGEPGFGMMGGMCTVHARLDQQAWKLVVSLAQQGRPCRS